MTPTEQDPYDRLSEWLRGDTEVDGSYRAKFAADVKVVLERYDSRTADLKDLVLAILDEPQGIDVLNRLLKRAMEYNQRRVHR